MAKVILIGRSISAKLVMFLTDKPLESMNPDYSISEKYPNYAFSLDHVNNPFIAKHVVQEIEKGTTFNGLNDAQLEWVKSLPDYEEVAVESVIFTDEEEEILGYYAMKAHLDEGIGVGEGITNAIKQKIVSVHNTTIH